MIERLELLKGGLNELKGYFSKEIKNVKDKIDIKQNENFELNANNTIINQLHKISKYENPMSLVTYCYCDNNDLIVKSKFVYIIK